MAALVVRSADDKVLLSGLGHSHFQAEKAARIRNEEGGLIRSAEGGRRSRKGKNGPKKQPQRGLGVAQLEKLRLQEQSKQEAACLASLGLMPLPSSYGFTSEQGNAVCLPHVLAHHVKGGTLQMNTALLSLGSGYRSSADRNSVPLIAGTRGFQTDPMWLKDGEAPISHMHSLPDPSPLQGQASSLSILLPGQQDSFHLSAPQMTKLCAPGVSKAPSAHLVSLHMNGMERQQQRHVDEDAEVFITAMRGSRTECGRGVEMMKQDTKAYKTGDGGGHPLSLNSVELFDSSLPPGPLQLQRDSRELSMLGIPSNPKELSSFQTKFPGNQVVWPTMNNASGQKRPCIVLQENPRVLISMDPNASHGSSETPDIQKGAHYTPHSISNALGKSPLPFMKAGEKSMPKPDDGNKPNVVLGFDDMKGCKGDPNDSLSSVSSMSPPFLQRKRACSYDSSSPRKIGNPAAGDFLALRLSISHTEVESKESGSFSNTEKSLSFQETVTDGEECSERSPSYGSSMDVPIEVESISTKLRSCGAVSFPPSKCGITKPSSAIDLSLKLAI